MTPIISRYGLSIRMEVGRARFYRRAGPGPGSTYCADARLLVGTATRRFKSGCGLKTVGLDGRTDGIDGVGWPRGTHFHTSPHFTFTEIYCERPGF